MAACAYCNTTIVFGGVKQGDLRYCNAECAEASALLGYASQLPAAEVQRAVVEVSRGLCPRCHGLGPVDVHTTYRVWSALFMTSWSSRPAVCCQSCGKKQALQDGFYSAVLGWWGFPWGLVMTPVQIVRNIIAFSRDPGLEQPSPELERMVRLELAASLVQRQQAGI